MKASLLAHLLLLLAAPFLSAQGPLTPPGAPAPMMKSLDQIEARTPIPASPATPVNGPHFTITTPGSYYLTGNVTVNYGHGILINSSDVTLDLNGFRIASTNTSQANGTAVFVSSGSRLTIRNGNIKGDGFSRGISGDYIMNQTLVENIHISAVSGTAIALGYFENLGAQNIVKNCTVKSCNSGIFAEEVVECSVNQAKEYGIVAQNATNCSVGSSESSGIEVIGNAINCRGHGRIYGMFCGGNATNCLGSADSNGNGLSVAGNALNCRGTSYSGNGLTCSGNATNCTAMSEFGNTAMNVAGTASFCRAKRNGGVAIQATIAIGCTVDGTGTITSAQKHLGTP